MRRAMAPMAAISVMATASIAFASPSFFANHDQARATAQKISIETRAFLNVARFRPAYTAQHSAALSAVQRLHLAANQFLAYPRFTAPAILVDAFHKLEAAFVEAQQMSGWLETYGNWDAIASVADFGSVFAAPAPAYVPAYYVQPVPVNVYRPARRAPARRPVFVPWTRPRPPFFGPATRSRPAARPAHNARWSAFRPATRSRPPAARPGRAAAKPNLQGSPRASVSWSARMTFSKPAAPAAPRGNGGNSGGRGRGRGRR